MDPKMYHYLKHNVTCIEPAIIADSTTKAVMTMFDIPWEMEFVSDEEYMDFLRHFEEKFVSDIDSQVDTLNAVLDINPTLWLMNEFTFSKLLYNLRLKFVKSALKSGNQLFDTCLKILYYANVYYKCGLIEAPDMAFVEVYHIVCDFFRTQRLW